MCEKIIFASVLLLFVSCGGERRRQNDNALESGRMHALKFIEAQPMTEMELQNCLIEVRSNEEKLRRAGYDEAASKYVETFESTISTECDSLAKIIF